MLINNPKTSAGGLPLATTWYVNASLSALRADTTLYVENVEKNITSSLTTSAAVLSADFVNADNILVSGLVGYLLSPKASDSGLAEALRAQLNNSGIAPDAVSSLPLYGYATLDSTGHVNSDLMPDLSIIDVHPTVISDLVTWATTPNKGYHWTATDGSIYRDLEADASKADTYAAQMLAEYASYLTTGSDAPSGAFKFEAGDILVLAWPASYELPEQFTETHKRLFNPAVLGGAWITYRNEADHTKCKLTRISYNQGQARSVNGILPDNLGNILLPLSAIVKQEYRFTDSAAKAKAMLSVSDSELDSDIRSELANLPSGAVEYDTTPVRFTYDKGIAASRRAYATINEFADLNAAVAAVQTAVDAISAAADASATAADTIHDELSSAISGEIKRAQEAETGLSTAIDNVHSSLSGLQGDVLDYLSSLYGSLTSAEEALMVQKEFNVVNGRIGDYLDPNSHTYYDNDYAITVKKYTDVDLAASAAIYQRHEFSDVFEYLGVPRNSDSDIDVVIISGIPGRVYEVYTEVQPAEGEADQIQRKTVKLDPEIQYYQETNSGLWKSQIQLIYTNIQDSPYDLELDPLIVRYLKPFECLVPTTGNIKPISPIA